MLPSLWSSLIMIGPIRSKTLIKAEMTSRNFMAASFQILAWLEGIARKINLKSKTDPLIVCFSHCNDKLRLAGHWNKDLKNEKYMLLHTLCENYLKESWAPKILLILSISRPLILLVANMPFTTLQPHEKEKKVELRFIEKLIIIKIPWLKNV